MQKLKRRGLYSFVIAVSVILSAGLAYGDAGIEEAAFLKIDAASRPVAMGGAFVGVANDVNSVFWNPAGLTQMEKRELTGMYNRWLAGINCASGAYAQPVGKVAAVGASVQWLGSEIEKRTKDSAEPDSIFNVYSLAVGLSGSFAIIPKVFSLGGTVKFINQDFDVADSNGWAADLGGLVRMGNLSLGTSVQNFVSGMNNDADVPRIIRAGASYQLSKDAIIAGEYTIPGTGDPSFHVGLEKWFRNIFAARVGYCFGSGDNPRKCLSAGFGLKAYGTKPL